MYTLKEAWILMHGEEPVKDWDGKIYCNETDPAITYRANETHGFMAAYSFTLVRRGWLTIVYNGKELTLHPDDLYIYSPGLPVSIIASSADYRGICLLADEDVTLETPSVRDLTHIAYQPVVQLHSPLLTLMPDDAVRLYDKMLEISRTLHSDHVYQAEILRMLYAIFLLDMQAAQERAIPHRSVSQRVEEIFINFQRILPHHFVEHHDIAFYAGSLNISPVYLSRIVRQVSGRTVASYINRHLSMEAAFLLRTSSLSIAQIADRLNFADQASFTKFFRRMKGVSPRTFREQRFQS